MSEEMIVFQPMGCRVQAKAAIHAGISIMMAELGITRLSQVL